MGISEIRLVKTLTSTAFSSYGINETVTDRSFQRPTNPEVRHPCTFQPGFFNQWHKIGVYSKEGTGIKERQTGDQNKKMMF
ncbi:hypothetical protein [Longitalea arenae]|uniref:hypothetical protein n=1 Tax=Longitalea arenae TaxID=2812558 RepID=UPI00196719F7|nr:hypothetical protein [Longitalea arenae]